MDTAANGLLRVNFSLRGFAKMINRNTVSPFTPEPVALETFGRYLASLSLKPDNAQDFVSVPEFRGIDYVGYVIEKERLDPTSGAWVRLEEYRIIGSQACSYKDTRVAYGQSYRYRIRTVVKFTTYQHVTQTLAALQKNLASVVAATLQNDAVKNQPLINRLLPVGLQSRATVGKSGIVTLSNLVSISNTTAGVPQFQFNVPTPALQQINSAAQTSITALQAALATSQPIDNTTLQSHVNNLLAGTQDTSSTGKYMSEYIVSYPSRNWQYVTIKNNSLPDWPEAIQIVPSTPNSTIGVYWLTPPDAARDMQSVSVYRRLAVGDPWALVAPNLPLTQNFYVDTDVKMGQNYIYALQSTNVHGYVSFLSTQVQAALNPSFQFEQKERDLVWISGPGAQIGRAHV